MARRWARPTPIPRGVPEYNQVINGGKFYTQEEFSNLAFKNQGPERVVPNQAHRNHPAGPTSAAVASIFEDATPTRLPADGSSTASISSSWAITPGTR